MEIISTIVIVIGIIFMAFGVVALFRFDNFYARILATSKIDTVGVITIIFGMALRYGFSVFTGKVLVLAVIILILNPLVAHILVRSANKSDYTLQSIARKEDVE